MKKTLAISIMLTSGAVLADETRQLDAHEHGVGELNIAIEGSDVAIELHAPGADIVGFEYAATSEEDRAAIAEAVATLARPLDLFVLPEGAGCVVMQASAELETEDGHDAHDAHHDHEHGEEHEEHAEHDEHGHGDEEHAAHDDHGHDDEDHAAHDDHGHEDEASHTEFHAEYMLDCAQPENLTGITFAYFDSFENARELEVQIVTEAGAQAFEVERDAPVLDLRSLF